MIYFHNDSELPILAAITLGVSVKEGEKNIGRYGTGLKYSIAGILRLEGQITITIDGERHEFTTQTSDIRGKKFHVVHHNGNPCGFTTELGKHWEPWMYFRELASNALDEGGSWTTSLPPSARTVIQVDCASVEESRNSVFMKSSDVLAHTEEISATISVGDSPYIYYRGIRAADGPTPYTINTFDLSLSEERKIDVWSVMTDVAYTVAHARHLDSNLAFQIATNSNEGFWKDVCDRMSTLDNLPFETFKPLRHLIKNTRLQQLIRNKMDERGELVRNTISLNARMEKMISRAERMCDRMGLERIPRESLFFTDELPKETFGMYDRKKQVVWISTLALAGTDDEFLKTYLEENIHRVSGAMDHTRAFQEFCLRLLVSIAPKR